MPHEAPTFGERSKLACDVRSQQQSARVVPRQAFAQLEFAGINPRRILSHGDASPAVGDSTVQFSHSHRSLLRRDLNLLRICANAKRTGHSRYLRSRPGVAEWE